MIPGQVIVIGQADVSCTWLPTREESKRFLDALSLSDRRGDSHRAATLRSFFGDGTVGAIMPPDAATALALAETYAGPHRETVRRMAARIAAGLFGAPGADEPSDDSNGGAQPAIPAPKPVKPRPGGAAIRLPDSGAMLAALAKL